MSFDAGAIVSRMTLDLNTWERGVERVRKDTTSMQGWILRNQAQVTQLGRAFTIAGAAITGAYVLSSKSAMSFESAFAGVRKTVEATEAEFSQLESSLIDMSNTLPMSASNLAGIMEIAGQLGVRGVKNLTKFTETVAKISVTTNLTKEAAATDFARIANIMQEPLTNVDRMGASIVDLGNNFATTEAEISAFAQRIAGSANVVGLTTADIFGIGAAFSSVGVAAERGGTAVSKALIKIGEAIKTGNSELKTFAQVSGMTTDEFKKAFEQDAGQAFARFIDGLGRGGLQAAQILEDLELGDQRLKQAFLSVGGAGGILTEALNKSSNAWKENTALTEEARKRFATTESILRKTWNTIVNLTTKIGVLLLPAINRLLNFISGIVINLQRWVDNNKTLATVLTYVGVAVGVLVTALGLLALALPGIITSIILFKSVTYGATIAVLGLDVALGPIILTILGVTAAIIATIVIIAKWQLVIGALRVAWWSFAAGVNEAVAAIISAIATFLEKMEKIPGIGKKFSGAAETMRTSANNLKLSAEDCRDSGVKAFEDMSTAAENAKGITDDAVNEMKDAFEKLKNGTNNLSEDTKGFWNGWKKGLTESITAFQNFGQLGIDIANNFVDSMDTLFTDVFYSAFTGNLDDMKDAFTDFGKSLIRLAAQIVGRLIAYYSIIKPIASTLGINTAVLGFAEGTDSVPYTGIYRLHEGEKVVPKYDANNTGNGGSLTIVNQITPQFINAAIASDPDTVINVINSDILSRGTTRKTIKRNT